MPAESRGPAEVRERRERPGRPGVRSSHNGVYWDGRPYLGLGNGAHSYLHPLRRWNLRGWDAYREEAAAVRLPLDQREILDTAAHRLERVWLALWLADPRKLDDALAA